MNKQRYLILFKDDTNTSQDIIRLSQPVSGSQIQPPAATRFLQFDGGSDFHDFKSAEDVCDDESPEEAFNIDDLDDDTDIDVETEDDTNIDVETQDDFVDFVQVDGAADNDQGTIFTFGDECVFAITAKRTHPLVYKI